MLVVKPQIVNKVTDESCVSLAADEMSRLVTDSQK